jgi:hypothetical protein
MQSGWLSVETRRLGYLLEFDGADGMTCVWRNRTMALQGFHSLNGHLFAITLNN